MKKSTPQISFVAPDVFVTSVLNPSMRVFDVVMGTKYGTSYNSYLVSGTTKTALIETSHATFATDWLEKVEAVLAGSAPDYLVMNHNEPDHSGAVVALLEHYPDVEIVISAAGAINLRHITNRTDLKLTVVKDTDSLDLGGLTLHFMMAPLLHWPDTMFTWLPERKVLFSCDFLGAHFCEPRLFDHAVVYRRAFTAEIKNYFDSIMGPFKPFVLKGLDKLNDLDIDFICPSHGPILTKGCELENSLQRYREWAMPAQKDTPDAPHIALFYCSAYGNTAKLAQQITRGVTEALPAAQVDSYNLVETEPDILTAKLNDADALLIGSPTINRDALPVVWELLAGIDAINIIKRPVALFGSYGWSGEAVPHLAQRFEDLKARVFEQKFKVRFVPTDADLEAAAGFGRDFAASLSGH
ncbi:MAG: FprA family A-type flavoprotein [Coriobacteriales bacterium]|nr:FprA family A-type flavoprotein [Coriobacteriales bacterium]